MITRNAIVISVSVVLLVVSVALVLVSGKNTLQNEPLVEEETFTASLCSYAPVGDYMICCEDELGREIDCTEKTVFKPNEKVSIIVNQNILQNEEAPYLLCSSSDLLDVRGMLRKSNEEDDSSACVNMTSQIENFAIAVRKEGFVPSEHPSDELTLLQLSTAQNDYLDSREILFTITASFAR